MPLVLDPAHAIMAVFEFVEKDGHIGVIDGFFAVVHFEVAFCLVGFDGPIVDKNLIPRAFAVIRAGLEPFRHVLTAFKVGVGIHNYAPVTKPFVMHDLTDPK